jgi:hypothetical protein
MSDPATLTEFTLWLVGLWAAAVTIHALVRARSQRLEPAPPEPPEHH